MLCFTGVPLQGHLKIISMSLQYQNSKKDDFYRLQTHLGCRWILQMTSVDALLVGYHSRTHRRGLYAILAFWHITSLSQIWSESTKLLKCSCVKPQREPPWKHWYRIGYESSHGVVLYLTRVSPQGHLKVISRSLQVQNEKNMIFLFLKPILLRSSYIITWDTDMSQSPTTLYWGGGGGVVTISFFAGGGGALNLKKQISAEKFFFVISYL